MGKFLDIAKMVLGQEGKPMRVTDIIEKARELSFMDFSGGETPHQTIKARISEDIKRKKDQSDFKRVGKGLFALRNFEQQEYDAIPYAKKIPQNEYVLVIKRKVLEEYGLFNGVKDKHFQKQLSFLLDSSNTFFVPRIQAETDTDHKQILSYVIVEKNNKLIRFVRGVYTNAHSMLRGSLCIGFGGHVQSSDFNLFQAAYNDNGYMNSVKRELLEELKIPEFAINLKTFKIIGILNDDSSEIGKSHIAIIHKLNLDKVRFADVKKLRGEKSINQLNLIPINELGDDFEKYEYWSKLCIKSFYSDHIELSCKIHRVKNYSLAKHPKVIIIVGSIGSGKTEASRILQEGFGYQFISSGKILQKLMCVKTINKLGRKKFQNLAYQFVQKEKGFEQLGDNLLNLIKEDKGKRYVIDGIRNIKTYEHIKSKLGMDCTLIFVESTPDNCYKFYKKRENIVIDPLLFYEFLNHPVERDIKVLLGKANFVVYNHGSLSSFQNQIKKFFKTELEQHA